MVKQLIALAIGAAAASHQKCLHHLVSALEARQLQRCQKDPGQYQYSSPATSSAAWTGLPAAASSVAAAAASGLLTKVYNVSGHYRRQVSLGQALQHQIIIIAQTPSALDLLVMASVHDLHTWYLPQRSNSGNLSIWIVQRAAGCLLIVHSCVIPA